MASEEEVKVAVFTADSPAKTPINVDVLLSAARERQNAALSAANMSTPPPTNTQATIAMPVLEEATKTGYVRGEPQTIQCCKIGSFWVEKNTAYDYLLMANAAAKDGINLPINAAFRDMELQTKLWIERVAYVDSKGRAVPTAAGVKLGVAAKPGWSNHQSGIALDIYVKMTKADYIAGNYTPEFLWLKGEAGRPGNAERFGFNHSDGAPVNEPWHWIHPEKRIVGISAFEATTGLKVAAFDTAAGAMNTAQTGLLRTLFTEVHDRTTAIARTSGMAATTRAGFNAAGAVFSAQQGAGIANAAGQYTQSSLTLGDLPPGFKQSSLAPLTYNFQTGLWGDGKPV